MRDHRGVSGRRPLLLLDVDGVLNPYAALVCPSGYVEHELFVGEEPVRVCTEHGRWVHELAIHFEVVWATAWGAEANRLLAPLLELPHLPKIRFPPAPFDPRDKLLSVISYAAQRPLVWLDDEFPVEAHAWAAKRAVATLLIDVNPVQGLTRPIIDQSLRWADERERGID